MNKEGHGVRTIRFWVFRGVTLMEGLDVSVI
jgi:hypothetical protein